MSKEFKTPKQRHKEEQESIKKLLSITDEDISKMNYKEKQKYFREKNKLCRIHKSK